MVYLNFLSSHSIFISFIALRWMVYFYLMSLVLLYCQLKNFQFEPTRMTMINEHSCHGIVVWFHKTIQMNHFRSKIPYWIIYRCIVITNIFITKVRCITTNIGYNYTTVYKSLGNLDLFHLYFLWSQTTTPWQECSSIIVILVGSNRKFYNWHYSKIKDNK